MKDVSLLSALAFPPAACRLYSYIYLLFYIRVLKSDSTLYSFM
jgi:hypothetical protein